MSVLHMAIEVHDLEITLTAPRAIQGRWMARAENIGFYGDRPWNAVFSLLHGLAILKPKPMQPLIRKRTNG